MDLSRRYAKATDVAGEVIDGEAVIINLATGVYYSMDRVGARCWEALAAGHSPDEIVEAVVSAYDVGRDSAMVDIARVVEALLKEGLLTSETAPLSGTLVAFPAGAYAPPALTAYRDMGDLLALDPPAPGLDKVPWNPPSSPSTE